MINTNNYYKKKEMTLEVKYMNQQEMKIIKKT